MIDLPDLLVFVAALVAVYLLPGPDMALVVSSSAFRGPRSGLMAALGLALSRTLHVTLSALGLAALFHAHPMLFDSVRWLGAAYLMWLAWKIARSGEGAPAATATGADAGWAALRRGVMTNLLNPKALMFCALLLPQFVSTQHALSAQYLLLGSVLVGIGLLFDVAYALAASSLAKHFSGSRSIRKTSKLVFSGVFGFAALRLAIGGS
ncbi:MAG TPA: LysE family translocator [Rhodocyclaceae bacterium]|nr:LysE family translocator [Rhodocyclaceae bacterium]